MIFDGEVLICIFTTQKKVVLEEYFHFINYRFQKCVMIIKDERSTLLNLKDAGQNQIYLFDLSLEKKYN